MHNLEEQVQMEKTIVARLNGIKAEAEREFDSMSIALKDFDWISNPTAWIERYLGNNDMVDERGIGGIVEDFTNIKKRDMYVIQLVNALIENDKTYEWMKTPNKLIWGLKWESLVDSFMDYIKA